MSAHSWISRGPTCTPTVGLIIVEVVQNAVAVHDPTEMHRMRAQDGATGTVVIREQDRLLADAGTDLKWVLADVTPSRLPGIPLRKYASRLAISRE